MNRLFLFFLILLSTNAAYALNPLPAHEAFRYDVRLIDHDTAIIDFNVADDYFLYKERLKIHHTDETRLQLGPIRLPPGEFKEDEIFGEVHLLTGELQIPLAVTGLQPGVAELLVDYQGCSREGFCYPPATLTVQLTIDEGLGLQAIALVENTQNTTDTTPINPATLHWAFDYNIFLIILSFLGLGLLLSFTPCVLPMIPIISSIVVGQKDKLDTRKAFLLSLTYVLAMAATYAIAGMVVALLGQNLQVAFQQPIVIIIFSLFFVLLALSMFDVYELRMPTKFTAYIARITRQKRHGAYISTALIGCLATLLVSPCVTAPLIGTLAYITQTGDVFIGGSALFALGLGMGIPLLIIGTSAGRLLPKAGYWMNQVKIFFGILLLATAIYLLDRILNGSVILALWGSLAIFSALCLGALNLSSTSLLMRLQQTLAIVLLLYGSMLIFGAGMGNQKLLTPLQPNSQTQQKNQQAGHLIFDQNIKNLPELKHALNQAKHNQQPVFIDIYADWCVSCKKMQSSVFQQAEIISALAPYYRLKIDVSENNSAQKALLKYLNAIAPPTFIFFEANGMERKDTRIVGEVTAQEFLQRLNIMLLQI